ncbi:MAG: exodeoxyribonuclease I [Cellvibrionaceae bacterium]|nr:exodeoxyribonuclease I [Cellvibrionaceae bacterium]
MNSLYWHDYETWGISPSRDKPVQFAGVRTDEQLNIIGEPLMLYCKPTVDCLPNPEACLVTGITPQKAQQAGCAEPAFMAAIYQQLAQPGTCGVGYNSIRFDDEVTRYGLYRNFYDPYEREWKRGNSRWDIIDVVRLCYALRPQTLAWPTTADGGVSFQLEQLSLANGLEHASAHDAWSDVYATIALAKLIQSRQPQLYDYAYQLRAKRKVMALIDLKQRKPLLHISSRFPSSQGCAALVVPLMKHPRNHNSVICYNLAADPQPLLSLSSDEIHQRLYTKQDALPEGVARIALKEIHLNKSPMIATPKLLDSRAAERLGIDKTQCEQHWQQLRQADLQQTLTEVYSRNPFAAVADPEQQLYDGFIADHDRNLFTAMRSAAPEQLAGYASQLQDKRLQTLLFRYRARHYPHTLTEDERNLWQQWCYRRLTDYEAGASIVLDDYFERLAALSADATVDQALLNSLYDYGDGLLADT